jgi:serine/threonine-protein kinase
MALTAGSRIGLYEIVAPLGAGGMGEVYRARDTRLNRDVAIKILPEALAGDPDRLARFEREAQALAALNHPNIAGVYAVEGLAIVMELVSGEDLSARIGRGPIPLAEALPLARQIADAIDAAHEAGIIHRDLKPANIKVKDDGTVKVLDFGLAKALEPPGEPSAEAMNSPTLTNRGTRMGVILGTAAYMAPEQARGKVVDKRADIWAFGVVLYEMLTGVRPFAGDNVTDLLAAVVRAEPDWNALPRGRLRSCADCCNGASQKSPRVGCMTLRTPGWIWMTPALSQSRRSAQAHHPAGSAQCLGSCWAWPPPRWGFGSRHVRSRLPRQCRSRLRSFR